MHVSTGLPAARTQTANAVPQDVFRRVRLRAESVGGRPVFASETLEMDELKASPAQVAVLSLPPREGA
jgi:hypothetical protein